METLVDTLRKQIKVGETNGRPWAIVRFKDMWDAGLANVRRDKLEASLATVLAEAGINTEGAEEDPLPSYVNFVSNKGLTVYVGRTEIEDWASASAAFDAIKEVIEAN